MADNIVLKRLDGGILCPSITWSGLSEETDGVSTTVTIVGSGPSFSMRSELVKMRNVMTNWGIYKSHSIQAGYPGIYDQVRVVLQSVNNPPIYLYDFDAPTSGEPLGNHPSYRTYWDHHIVSTAKTTIAVTELDDWQEQTEIYTPTGATAGLSWQKATAPIPKNQINVNILNSSTTSVQSVSGHKKSSAKKPGASSYLLPSISIRETIYFTEEKDVSFTLGPITFSEPRLNTKSVASMAGKAGWPMRNTFGYPKDVYTLLNDSSYANFLEIGVSPTGTRVNLTEQFIKSKGIPITRYIQSNYNGYYAGETFGHPLWICKSCQIRRIGYWYEATLSWSFYLKGIDADLYPIADARTKGLA